MEDWKLSGELGVFDESSQNLFFNGYGQHTSAGFDAIFPIIQKNDNPPWKPIGTGFFISTMGMFATARHVLAEPNSTTPRTDLAGIQIYHSTREIRIRDVDHIALHPTADVAIGFLHDSQFIKQGIRRKNLCFELTRKIPSPGQKVVAYGFPNPLTIDQDKVIKIIFKNISFIGLLEQICPNGEGILKNQLCFRTSMSTSPGTSGGPVSFGDGKIFAVISAGVEGMPLNYISPIIEILDLPIPGVKMRDGSIRTDLKVHDLENLNLIAFDR